MRKAIITRILPATTYKGTRIKAKIIGKSITRSYDYSLNSSQNHVKVAHELARILEWKVGMLAGSVEETFDHVHIIFKDFKTWEEFDKYLEDYLKEVG